MKEIEWLNPNKMKFDSEHKVFNKEVVCVSKGNVVGPTQLSKYIHSYMDQGDDPERPKDFGAHQKYDLDWIFKGLTMDNVWRRRVESVLAVEGKHTQTVLYCFKHYSYQTYRRPQWRTIVDGLVLTKGRDDNFDWIATWYVNPRWKAQSAVDEATKYIANNIHYDRNGWVFNEKEIQETSM